MNNLAGVSPEGRRLMETTIVTLAIRDKNKLDKETLINIRRELESSLGKLGFHFSAISTIISQEIKTK